VPVMGVVELLVIILVKVVSVMYEEGVVDDDIVIFG
jgi:hypothetical protein